MNRERKWTIICFFSAALTPLAYKLERLEEENIKIKQNQENLSFVDLWWPDLWPDIKTNEVFS